MGSNNSHSQQIPSPLPISVELPSPTGTYCQGENRESGSYLASMKDRFHKFIHASKDEHKACFNKYIEKITGMTTILGAKTPDSSAV
ncbi:hypothetical protein SO802_025389 [Lithocarpus litseifolius]|uniref:Uncharacterized protein n=1 Tax=Lithocarpus litseifolius TaxID=425828 RepID=A0AAW2BZY0_9ROSI